MLHCGTAFAVVTLPVALLLAGHSSATAYGTTAAALRGATGQEVRKDVESRMRLCPLPATIDTAVVL